MTGRADLQEPLLAPQEASLEIPENKPDLQRAIRDLRVLKYRRRAQTIETLLLCALFAECLAINPVIALHFFFINYAHPATAAIREYKQMPITRNSTMTCFKENPDSIKNDFWGQSADCGTAGHIINSICHDSFDQICKLLSRSWNEGFPISVGGGLISIALSLFFGLFAMRAMSRHVVLTGEELRNVQAVAGQYNLPLPMDVLELLPALSKKASAFASRQIGHFGEAKRSEYCEDIELNAAAHALARPD